MGSHGSTRATNSHECGENHGTLEGITARFTSGEDGSRQPLFGRDVGGRLQGFFSEHVQVAEHWRVSHSLARRSANSAVAG